jgi:hypothetical protein
MSKTNGELISAATYVKTVARLHAHLGPGSGSQVDRIASGLQQILEATGKGTFAENVKTFFDVIDKAWGVQRISFREGAVYLRANFLFTLARVFSNHTDFWKEKRLFVNADLIRKLQGFPCRDPHVQSLATSAGTAGEILYQLIVEHLNKGKSTRRLTPRIIVPAVSAMNVGEESDDGEDDDESGVTAAG